MNLMSSIITELSKCWLYNASDDTEDTMLDTLPNKGACIWVPEPVLLGRCGSTTGRSGI